MYGRFTTVGVAGIYRERSDMSALATVVDGDGGRARVRSGNWLSVAAHRWPDHEVATGVAVSRGDQAGGWGHTRTLSPALLSCTPRALLKLGIVSL